MNIDWSNWKEPGRDAVIVYAFTVLCGYLLGSSGITPTSENAIIYQVFGSLMLIVGFTLIGSTTRHAKGNYLSAVAFLVWLLNLSNVPLGNQTLPQWVGSGLGIFLCAAVGGLVSSGLTWLRETALHAESVRTHPEREKR